jgi:DNA polymerase-3 subunit beta
VKVIVERGALFKAIGHAASVVEKKSTIPILANVLLEAEGEELRLTATDLELQIQLPVPAQVREPGAVTVQAALLQSILREVPDGAQVDLELDSENGRLNLVSGRARYKLARLPATDFPVMQPSEDAVSFTIAATALKEMVGKVAHAQSNDPARYFLNGACLEAHAGALFIVATDGFCVGSDSIAAPEGATEIQPAIIPRKTVGELTDIFGEAEGELTIALTAKQLRVSSGEMTLTSKLIDGTFPDWRRVVPVSNPHHLHINREAFAAAIRRAVVVSTDKVRSVMLELAADKLTVRTFSHEHGEGVEEVPVEYGAPELALRMNARLLLDTLAAMGGAEIEVRLENPRAPALFINPADKSAQWVVMPMSV